MSKIRMGFISNSSSSSFLICGKELKELPEGYDPKLYALGCGGSEGDDFFKVTPEMYAVICNDRNIRDDLTYYLVEKTFNSEVENVLTDDLPKGCYLYPKHVDYGSCSSVEELESRYGE